MKKEHYNYTAEEMKDIVLEENIKLRRQLSENMQSFELMKFVHYDRTIDLNKLNDIIVGCTGCLYAIIYHQNKAITNLPKQHPLHEIIRKNKNHINRHKELFVSDAIADHFTIVMYPITSSQMIQGSEAVRNIILIYPTKMVDEEVLELIRSFMIVTEVLINIVITRTKMIELIERDALTGAYNRGSWAQKIEYMKTNPEPQFMLFIDVDYFKNVNDHFGHQKGDELLKFLTFWLTSSFENDASIYRLGGDEFAVIGTLPKNRKEFTQHLQELNKKYKEAAKVFLNIDSTISIGAILMENFPDYDVYVALDNLLYQSKNEGRNRITIYNW